MLYAKVIDGVLAQYPYTRADLRADNPTVGFPTNLAGMTLADWNVVQVIEQPDPAFDPVTEYLVPGTPVLVVDEWQVTQAVVAKGQEQLDAEAEEAAQQSDKALLKADPQILALLKARPAAIENYIDNNVNNLAEAKTVLKILAKTCAVLAQAVVS